MVRFRVTVWSGSGKGVRPSTGTRLKSSKGLDSRSVVAAGFGAEGSYRSQPVTLQFNDEGSVSKRDYGDGA